MARIACLFSVEFYDSLEHPLSGWDKIPFGLSVIASCLEQAGHVVQCWVVCPRTRLDGIVGEILEDFGCDSVEASAVSTQFPLISRVCQRIKECRPSVPILLGGVHATIQPEVCISHPAIDALCIGEGEDVALAWANAIERGEQPFAIPGVWFKNPDSHEVVRTSPAPFRNDLDQLPLINYEHWERWIDPHNRLFRIVVGRGCPYACTYCSNHALRAVQNGAYLRFRSPANILSELRVLVSRFPQISELNLEIETIGASIPWAIQLCNALAEFNAQRTEPIAFSANLAVTTALLQHEERLGDLLAAFHRANLRTLRVGLESGSERIRKEILNRPIYTNDDLIRFAALARSHGIRLILFTLTGVPTETPEEALQTSRIARACQPSEIEPSIFYPYPGTKLHDIAQEMGLIDPSRMGRTAERSRAYLKLKDFPRWRVFLEYVLLPWRVFHGRRKTSSLVLTMISRALAIIPELQMTAVRLRHGLRVHQRTSE